MGDGSTKPGLHPQCCGCLWWRKSSKGEALDLLVYVATFTCDHEVWITTKRTRSWIQAVETSFLGQVAKLSLGDVVKSTKVLLLSIKWSQLRLFRHLMPSGCLCLEVFLACPPVKQPQGKCRTRWKDYIISGLGSSRSWKVLLIRGSCWFLSRNCSLCDPTTDEQKNMEIVGCI